MDKFGKRRVNNDNKINCGNKTCVTSTYTQNHLITSYYLGQTILTMPDLVVYKQKNNHWVIGKKGGHGFEQMLGQTKYFKIGIYFSYAKHTL